MWKRSNKLNNGLVLGKGLLAFEKGGLIIKLMEGRHDVKTE